jgi:hypothetical protein
MTGCSSPAQPPLMKFANLQAIQANSHPFNFSSYEYQTLGDSSHQISYSPPAYRKELRIIFALIRYLSKEFPLFAYALDGL